MAEKYLHCDHCGKVNPMSARVCLDCGTQLRRAGDAVQISPADKSASGHKTTGEVLERFDRDESLADSNTLKDMQRVGDDLPPDAAEPPMEFESSRAYEVERHTFLDDEVEELKLTSDLESMGDARARVSAESSEFVTTRTLDPMDRTPPPEITAPRPVQPPFPVRDKRPPAPRHRSPWEKSDVEIMTSVRRRNIARGILGRSLPLVVLAAAMVLGSRFVVFPMVLPGGTWQGTIIDHAGDSQIHHFTVRVKRSGNRLSGTFWLVRNPGDPPSEAVGAPVPYSLQGLYAGRPIPVSGNFDRTTLELTLRPRSSFADETMTFTGEFDGRFKASGTSVNGHGIRSDWKLRKKGIL